MSEERSPPALPEMVVKSSKEGDLDTSQASRACGKNSTFMSPHRLIVACWYM